MILKERINIATLFLLPLIADSKTHDFFTLTNNLCLERNSSPFVNVYIGDISKPFWDNHIFVLYDNSTNKTDYMLLRKELRELPSYCSDYDVIIDNKGYTVFVFELSKEDKVNIEYIFNGNYNLIHSDTKVKIMKFWKAEIESKLHTKLYEPSKTIWLNNININEEIISIKDEIDELDIFEDEDIKIVI